MASRKDDTKKSCMCLGDPCTPSSFDKIVGSKIMATQTLEGVNSVLKNSKQEI